MMSNMNAGHDRIFGVEYLWQDEKKQSVIWLLVHGLDQG
jgi:hypothetical protein